MGVDLCEVGVSRREGERGVNEKKWGGGGKERERGMSLYVFSASPPHSCTARFCHIIIVCILFTVLSTSTGVGRR